MNRVHALQNEIECALKIVRLAGHEKGLDLPSVVVMENSFHGRSLAALSATGSRKVQAGFEPLVGGFLRVPFNDIKAVEKLSRGPNQIAAVLVEPIQGEAGIQIPDDGYLSSLRRLCDQHGWLLIFDEIQCGMGRCGTLFAHELYDVTPDIMTLAKGIGSGMPIGLIVARKSVMSKWKHGAHGNTYGGNPLACAAAMETLRLVESGYADNAAAMGEYFMDKLRDMATRFDVIGEVRGQGLMIGMELVKDRQTKEPAKTVCDELVRKAFQNGLLLLSCGVSTVRFMPPLMVDKAIIDEAMEMLEASLAEVLAEQ